MVSQSAKIAKELGVATWQVDAVIELIDEGNTIPFIARYRKEKHGDMGDEKLRALDERLRYLRNLDEKKQTAIAAIEEQGKLTEELRAQIENAETQAEVEDLYRPYRQKRKTRASVAKEAGLEPLANLLLLQQLKHPAEEEAKAFVDPEKGVADTAAALQGAKDIIAESISDEAVYRTWIRDIMMKEGTIASEAVDEKATSVYENYYHYEEALKKVAGHRILALNRGEKEKMLVVRLVAPEERILEYLKRQVIHGENPYTTPLLAEAVEDSYTRLIAPSVERQIRNELTEKAEDGAIHVFGSNLTQLLMQPPIAGKTVLGWDPAFRTGCKIAVVDGTGKVLDTTVVYPTAPQNRVDEATSVIGRLVSKYGVDVISVGNGTASRESEQIIVGMIKTFKRPVSYVIVNEAGASVYSASKAGTEEFPTFDVGERSAASIARRLQDPLAELVKIEPKAIGVGQYQHDMNQKKLSDTLTGVVEDCVNKVGVDLNTASAALLTYVSGLTKTTAKNIVTYREENGSFKNRKELLKVAKLGPKAFEQCAGFLRIRGGVEPLDVTGVHPESYEAAKKLIAKMGITADQLKAGVPGLSKKVKNQKALAEELGIGEMTLADILKELEKPGRDPREDLPKPVLRTDVLDMKDLKPGMVLTGTVRNVIDFGVFVDIGVHQDGLVHISEISKERFVKHPLDVVKVGDIVDVKVLSVDPVKKRIALSMKQV